MRATVSDPAFRRVCRLFAPAAGAAGNAADQRHHFEALRLGGNLVARLVHDGIPPRSASRGAHRSRPVERHPAGAYPRCRPRRHGRIRSGARAIQPPHAGSDARRRRRPHRDRGALRRADLPARSLPARGRPAGFPGAFDLRVGPPRVRGDQTAVRRLFRAGTHASPVPGCRNRHRSDLDRDAQLRGCRRFRPSGLAACDRFGRLVLGRVAVGPPCSPTGRGCIRPLPGAGAVFGGGRSRSPRLAGSGRHRRLGVAGRAVCRRSSRQRRLGRCGHHPARHRRRRPGFPVCRATPGGAGMGTDPGRAVRAR